MPEVIERFSTDEFEVSKDTNTWDTKFHDRCQDRKKWDPERTVGKTEVRESAKKMTILALRLSHNAGAAEALAGAWQCGHADSVAVWQFEMDVAGTCWHILFLRRVCQEVLLAVQDMINNIAVVPDLGTASVCGLEGKSCWVPMIFTFLRRLATDRNSVATSDLWHSKISLANSLIGFDKQYAFQILLHWVHWDWTLSAATWHTFILLT